MNDTRANQWIPVSERLPEVRHSKLVYTAACGKDIAYRCEQNRWWIGGIGELHNVTHWMDLPEPPAPPKPADPFEAWWTAFRMTDPFPIEVARAAWDAAKEHYAKPKDYDEHLKPLPDFETWWNKLEPYSNKLEPYSCKVRRFNDVLLRKDIPQAIWNAAQGKPEA